MWFWRGEGAAALVPVGAGDQEAGVLQRVRRRAWRSGCGRLRGGLGTRPRHTGSAVPRGGHSGPGGGHCGPGGRHSGPGGRHSGPGSPRVTGTARGPRLRHGAQDTGTPRPLNVTTLACRPPSPAPDVTQRSGAVAMRVWAGALRAAAAPGPLTGGFRERFDFGGRDVASWFPGHMARGEGTERAGWLPGRPAAQPALCCRPAADAGRPAARRLPHRGARRSHILRHGSSPPGKLAPAPQLPRLPPGRPFSQPHSSPMNSPRPSRSPLPPRTEPLSLAVPTSRCRAGTPCCRKPWASARTSWC